MPFAPEPIILEGRHVRLEPLAESHREEMRARAAEAGPATFRWFINDGIAEPGTFDRWFDAALEGGRRGGDLTWATFRRADGRLVGSTRYLDIRRAHRALEIGNTWLVPEAQRTAINTEAKFLQLRHAFEDLGAVRVQLKTDARNETSRRAIARLGCVLEGVLRSYQTRDDGFVRDTAMYSLTSADWPAARARLEQRIGSVGVPRQSGDNREAVRAKS
ncbi:MAG: GNAT family N-acetyltransferase [Opitutaceae bacterium]